MKMAFYVPIFKHSVDGVGGSFGCTMYSSVQDVYGFHPDAIDHFEVSGDVPDTAVERLEKRPQLRLIKVKNKFLNPDEILSISGDNPQEPSDQERWHIQARVYMKSGLEITFRGSTVDEIHAEIEARIDRDFQFC